MFTVDVKQQCNNICFSRQISGGIAVWKNVHAFDSFKYAIQSAPKDHSPHRARRILFFYSLNLNQSNSREQNLHIQISENVYSKLNHIESSKNRGQTM